MARVKFADPADRPDESENENSPLLSKSAHLHGSDGDGCIPDPNVTPRKGILTGGWFQRRGSAGSADRVVLPVHIRPRSQARRPKSPRWKTALIVLVVTILLVGMIGATVLLDSIEHPTGPFPRPPASPPNEQFVRNPAYLIKATHGAVATENIDCSSIGVDVLKEGGNAVDAAIASTFCIGVVNLFSSGIGGGGFMTVRIPPTTADKASEVWTIDFRETAPRLANATMYKNDPYSSKFGGLSVGTPGEIRGLEEAHRRWATLPWSRLIQPSVELASGWNVGRELGRRIQMFGKRMLEDPVLSAIFAPNGSLLQTGDRIYRTNYSRTLSTIASKGADAFYKGPIADAIVDKVRSTGGILSHEDLATYKIKVQPALTGTFKGKRVYTSHAPTSGPVLLHMMNILERYDLEGEGRTGLNTHRVVETMKFGFAARTKVSDPSFTNDTSRMDEISTKAFGNMVAPNVTDDTTHPPEYYNPIYDVHIDHGTSHTSVVDKDGMAVALTSTVNLVFGSQVMDPITGILLNDEMDDFSTPGIPNAFGLWPSPFNYPEPGKRPLSSTAPTIMEHPDGSFYLAVGGSGGSRIFGAIFQVILGLDQWGQDVSQAIEYGRIHDQLYPTEVDTDNVLPSDFIQALEQRGHNVTVSDVNRVAAVIQAVVKKEDQIFAASDSRKNGIAAGY